MTIIDKLKALSSSMAARPTIGHMFLLSQRDMLLTKTLAILLVVEKLWNA